MRKDRDLLKYNLEKTTEILKENNLEATLENTNEDENGNQSNGLKLIEEYIT